MKNKNVFFFKKGIDKMLVEKGKKKNSKKKKDS